MWLSTDQQSNTQDVKQRPPTASVHHHFAAPHCLALPASCGCMRLWQIAHSADCERAGFGAKPETAPPLPALTFANRSPSRQLSAKRRPASRIASQDITSCNLSPSPRKADPSLSLPTLPTHDPEVFPTFGPRSINQGKRRRYVLTFSRRCTAKSSRQPSTFCPEAAPFRSTFFLDSLFALPRPFRGR